MFEQLRKKSTKYIVHPIAHANIQKIIMFNKSNNLEKHPQCLHDITCDKKSKSQRASN